MHCPGCRRENRDDAVFCDGCGARVMASCASCGRDLRSDSRFCDGCGAAVGASGPPRGSQPPAVVPERTPRDYTPRHLADKILTSRSALEGERKQVTVLFADIKGSMELAEQVDAEEWHAILDRFFQIMTEGVHRFEGTVNQYTGDGIMALFGAPIAHEDHAQRACYAALQLQDELRRRANELRVERGLPIAVRIGLNSGEVVVGRIGDDLRMDYTAQGHTVGLAARMQQIAEPGKTYLAGATAHLVRGYFALEDLGTTSVKGVGRPVEVSVLAGLGQARSRLDISRARGFAKFVGRDEEMAVLESALVRAAGGAGQVVGILAEAGTGKSRLCFEFLERCRPRDATVYRTHCVTHGKAMPLAPVLELFRAAFGMETGDSDRSARDKIAGRLVQADPGLAEAMPLLFDFLGVPDPERPAPTLDPVLRERRVLEILRRFTAARGAREAIVVLIEDLHWIDAASDRFLAALVDVVSATRVLMIVNMRPGYSAPWMQKSFYRQIPLLPLGEEALAALLDDLVGGDPSLAELRSMVIERAGGNPFFVEEIVRDLVERGTLVGRRGAYRLEGRIETIAVPDAVQGVLAARIDRLEERDKHVLQAASVVGRTFPSDLLETVADLERTEVDRSIAALVDAELVYEESLYPLRVCAFKHALTRDVAYASLLGERKRELHATLASRLVQSLGGTSGERAGLIAHHYESARESYEAARWHVRAASWTGLANADECVAHCRRACDLLADVPETDESIRLALYARNQLLSRGVRAGVEGIDAEGILNEMRRIAARTETPAAKIVLNGCIGGRAYTEGRPAEAKVYFEIARRLARESHDTTALKSLLPWLVMSHALGSSYDKVREVLDEAGEPDLNLVAEQVGCGAAGWLESFETYSLASAGRIPEAIERSEIAIANARASRDPSALPSPLTMACMAWLAKGDVARATTLGREATRHADACGIGILQSWTRLNLTRSLLAAGELEEARRAIEEYERIVVAGQAGALLFVRGLYLLATGDLPRALEHLAFVTEGIRMAGIWSVSPAIDCALALALLAAEGSGAAGRVDELMARAEAVVDEHGYELHRPEIRLVRADLLLALGDESAASREIEVARQEYRRMGAVSRAAALDGRAYVLVTGDRRGTGSS